MLNKVILIGRATKDADLKFTSNGTAVANFSIAVRRNYKNQQGEYDTDFFDITAFRGLGESLGNHLKKGRLVSVEARLQQSSYENSEGRTVRVIDLVADEVTYLDKPKEQN
ncbi:single-stranded DNA-binding protein [Neobacillus sp. YIM B02564]|uniref:Single-stranded DNA-binding protein n=1 Tax=Neobacillus paridis TaxID=2803862 RepID=A0ABS1TPJ7_9BACI|nr:single-stranded DNA-binding protein [Neobacillus paridis]MBL4952151.1 single-stranded DNA-binding protein [Neobacillus paridis]